MHAMPSRYEYTMNVGAWSIGFAGLNVTAPPNASTPVHCVVDEQETAFSWVPGSIDTQALTVPPGLKVTSWS